MQQYKLHLIIPAFNEEQGIVSVLNTLFALGLEYKNLLVIDNASTDSTSERAAELGAKVLYEPARGYGAACLCGINYLKGEIDFAQEAENIVVFLDADYSDYPEDISQILEPILQGKFDFVLGSRLISPISRKAVPPIARNGNSFASMVMKIFYGSSYTDLGPFRAITWPALLHLDMADRTWGWTLEMQIKAAQAKLRTCEVAVRYRQRLYGKSKISQSLVGATKAAAKILWVLGTQILFRSKPGTYVGFSEANARLRKTGSSQ